MPKMRSARRQTRRPRPRQTASSIRYTSRSSKSRLRPRFASSQPSPPRSKRISLIPRSKRIPLVSQPLRCTSLGEETLLFPSLRAAMPGLTCVPERVSEKGRKGARGDTDTMLHRCDGSMSMMDHVDEHHASRPSTQHHASRLSQEQAHGRWRRAKYAPKQTASSTLSTIRLLVSPVA